MAESTVIKMMRDGTITLFVGVNTYVLKYEEGTLQLNVPGPSISAFLDRGRFADTVGGKPSLRYNEDQTMTGSFTARMRDMSDASYVTAEEFILKSGQYASAWGTSLGANEEVKTVDIQWDVEGTTHGDASDHQAIIPYSVITGALNEGAPNMINMNFTSYCLYPTVT